MPPKVSSTTRQALRAPPIQATDAATEIKPSIASALLPVEPGSPLHALSPTTATASAIPPPSEPKGEKAGKPAEGRFPPRTNEGLKQCTNCREVETPQWRGTLCNACALWKRSRGTDRPLPLLFPVRRKASPAPMDTSPSLSPDPDEARASRPLPAQESLGRPSVSLSLRPEKRLRVQESGDCGATTRIARPDVVPSQDAGRYISPSPPRLVVPVASHTDAQPETSQVNGQIPAQLAALIGRGRLRQRTATTADPYPAALNEHVKRKPAEGASGEDGLVVSNSRDLKRARDGPEGIGDMTREEFLRCADRLYSMLHRNDVLERLKRLEGKVKALEQRDERDPDT